MARSRYTARVSRGTSRKFIWARETNETNVAAGSFFNAHLLTDLETQLGSQLFGGTVTRVRGQILVTGATAPGTQAGFVQIGIRTYAENPDIQQVANANSEHADWLAWAFIPLHFGSDIPPEVGRAYRWELDVKAQRKMEEVGDGLMISVANNVAGMAITAQWGLSIGYKLA